MLISALAMSGSITTARLACITSARGITTPRRGASRSGTAI